MPEFPRVQAVPWSDQQVSFQVDGREVAVYHYGPASPRPYLFPLVGPAGRPVTRLTHPHDPVGHGHHRSVWVGHHDVNGHDFWGETAGTRLAHERIEGYEDGVDAASLTVRNVWLTAAGEALLTERDVFTLRPLQEGEWLLDVTLAFTPAAGDVTFGQTPFGFLAVRVAKTMGVHDGGGRILNSVGGVNEAGVFWQRAAWMDYGGLITPTERNGVAFFDHPTNPRHPTVWHVRDDGWMGASFTQAEPFPLSAGETLPLRYRLYVHADQPPEVIQRQWVAFGYA
jgi:hypothetical protein